MKNLIAPALICAALLSASFTAAAHSPAPGPEMILTRTTSKTPDQVVDAVKAYAEEKKWIYMGANKAKQGQVTMIKICIPQVGQQLWPVGLQLSALLPCGNIGAYEKGGKTEISMLHPRYMALVYPHPEVDKAVALATPLLDEMLNSLAK